MSNLEVIKNKDCFMIYHEQKLYVINMDKISGDAEQARLTVSKIINSDPSVKIFSYNGPNINYDVNGILVNSKPSDNRYPLKKKEYLLVRETAEMYRHFMRTVRPRIPKWVLNIFSGVAKGETVYLETSDYYLMPDFKWDYDINRPYLLILFKNTALQSIRDLRQEHLPMLERAYNDTKHYISQHYGHLPNVTRYYFHYQPSAWQLHMHVQHIDSPVMASYQSSKAVTYTDVVQNISMMSDYYEKATLECIVSNTDFVKYYGQ